MRVPIPSTAPDHPGQTADQHIKEHINRKKPEDLTTNIEDIIESVCIEICTTVGENIIIAVIYNKIEIFENAMNDLLNKID